MCGIAGFWGPPDGALLRAMTDILRHRGPDDEGYFESPGISLGHRRLAIIDLAGGHQPIANEDGQIQLAYNGEIYNFRELRNELLGLGHRFATESDSEVIVHAYEAWGVDAFARLNGMWAVALADLRAGRLVLSRDHFGIKPLYYARSGDRWIFGSEIKALLQDPALRTAPDEQALFEYLAYGLHDHRDATFFTGIQRLPQASYAVIEAGNMRVERYWQPSFGRDGAMTPAAFAGLFERAIARRLVADVPVGACLSGGLDSSAIVTVLSDLLRRDAADAGSLGERIQTFSAVFEGESIDERSFIEEAVAASGASSEYVRPTASDFLREVTDLVWFQEEPQVSTGPYAQWCVLREASRRVKVVLDGQGGDELLAGYVPYHLVYLRQLLRQRRLGACLREAWAARDLLRPLLTRRRRGPVQWRRLLRPEFLARVKPARDQRSPDRLKERLWQDLSQYSLPALLRYEDRNSMAHSVESRVPWLDPQLVAAILALPEEAIIHQGWNRAILRQALAGVLPERIRTRRWKVGFTTPEARWLYRQRATWQSLFRSPLFCSRPYWDAPAVARAFAACALRQGPAVFFWRLINVEVWLRVFFPNGAKGAEAVRRPSADFARLGDLAAASPAELGDFTPNSARHLVLRVGDASWLRAPRRAPLVGVGDDLLAVVRAAVAEIPRPGDIVVLTERIVAICQGRSFPRDTIRPRPLARLLTRFVRRTPLGIGLGIPETMELALRQAGSARILVAAVAAALTRPLGWRGAFYHIAGREVAAIDGPTQGTIPPYCDHVKLGPHDPAGVARAVAAILPPGVGVAIVDANDLGVRVLGHTADVDPEAVAACLVDNPKAQGREQTPIILLRPLGQTATGARGAEGRA